MNEDGDASSRVVWPAIIYGSGALICGLLTYLYRLPFLPATAIVPVRVLGIVILLAGLAIGATAVIGFRRAGTPIPPTQPTTAIVVEGPYRHTRNPMYLGFTIILAALALVTNSLWFAIPVPIAILAVTKLAIEPEERYLEAKFGERYVAYKGRVRRWL